MSNLTAAAPPTTASISTPSSRDYAEVTVIQTGRFDAAQIALAWAFVATRALHAVVYIGWNTIRYRFATWMASTITLAVLWFRFT